ncbi:cationic amino acid transporter 2, vacuolar-like protein [Tanacetum coccineum]
MLFSLGECNLFNIDDSYYEKSTSRLDHLAPILPEIVEVCVDNDDTDDDDDCDMPVCDESSPIFTIFSNPLFDSNENFSSDDEYICERGKFKRFSDLEASWFNIVARVQSSSYNSSRWFHLLFIKWENSNLFPKDYKDEKKQKQSKTNKKREKDKESRARVENQPEIKAGSTRHRNKGSESRKCISQLLCVHEENAQMRRCPSDGSAYHYSYICVGEGLAWIIRWALILEYTIRGSTVTCGISPNLALLFGGPNSLPFFLARHTIPGLGIVVDPFPAVLVFTVTRLLCVGVKEGTIAHALENTKYEVSYMKWKELDSKYHFSCQFTSDTSIFHHHRYFPRDCWKNKLQNPAGQHSDVPENLIPTVRKRVDVLREIQIGDITLDVRLTSYRE